MSDTILAYEDYAQDPVSALYGSSDLPYREYVSWLHEQTQGVAAPTDPPAGAAWVATVDAGRWVAQCIRCQAGMVVTPTDPVTLCPLCPTDWAPVEFPSTQRRAFIERELLQIPGWRLSAPAREWTPTMTNLQLRERVVRALEVAATLQPGEQVRALSIGAARVWTVGEILTAANENTHISDVLDDLAGRNGPVELVDSLEVADGTGRFLGLPKGATSTRPAHAAGRARFNTTTNLPEFSDGSAWREMGDAPILTYETLNDANQVGTGSSQVSRGNHTHAPGQVSALSIAPVTNRNDRLAVSWRAPFAGSSAITNYRVSRSLAGMNVWTEVEIAGTSTSHTLTGLAPNARYDVRVAAVNAVNAGPWSPVTSATTNDGRLYSFFGSTTPRASALVVLNPDGAWQNVSGFSSTSRPGGLAWHRGKLYTAIGTTFYTVDRTTGSLTELGRVTDPNDVFSGTGVPRSISKLVSDGANLHCVIHGSQRIGNKGGSKAVFCRMDLSNFSPTVLTTLTSLSGYRHSLGAIAWDGTDFIAYVTYRSVTSTGIRRYPSGGRIGALATIPSGMAYDGSRMLVQYSSRKIGVLDYSVQNSVTISELYPSVGIVTAYLTWVP